MTRDAILIAGGSLAGMACALRLRQWGHEVLVLDKAHFPRRKLCGEFLGPDAFPVLQTLGVFDAVHSHAYGPVERAFFHDMGGEALEIRLSWMNPAYPYALAIPRETLDALLIDAARNAGVTVLEGRRILTPLARQQNQFIVQTVTQNAEKNVRHEEYFSSWVIDATGRNGKLSIGETPDKPVHRERVGIQCHVGLAEPLPEKDLRMFLFPGGYGGIQPIAPDMVNVCMLTEAALGKAMRLPFPEFVMRTIGKNPVAANILRDGIRCGEFSATADVNMNWRDETDECGLIRTGDAQITVDPFTGSGMAHALETGVMAAECLHAGLKANNTYAEIRARYQREYARRFKIRLRLLKLFRPVLESMHVRRVLRPVLQPLLPALARTFR